MIFFSPSKNIPDRFLGPRIVLSNGYQGLISLGVKRPGREDDNSPLSSAEVKNSLHQSVSMEWCSVKRITGTAVPFLIFALK
jgi:hypothetical protein